MTSQGEIEVNPVDTVNETRSAGQLQDSEDEDIALLISQAQQTVQEVVYEKYCLDISKNLSKPLEEFVPSLITESIGKVTQYYSAHYNIPVDKLINSLNTKELTLQQNYKTIHSLVTKYHDQLVNSPEYLFASITPGKSGCLIYLEEIELQNETQQSLSTSSCEQLHHIHEEQTKKIIINETDIKQEVVDQIRRFYNQLITKGITEASHPISPLQLTQLHRKLLKHCLNANEQSMLLQLPFELKNSERNSNDKLRNLLSDDFKLLKKKNVDKLKKLQKIIESLISKHKENYCNQMEIVTEQKKNLSDLTISHNQLLNQVSSQLERDIKEHIGVTGSCQKYLQILATHIEKYWTNFQRLCTLELTETDYKPLNDGNDTTETWEKSNSYIIFQLSLTKIGVAVSDQTMNTHFETQGAIGVTRDEKWLYGTQAIKKKSPCRKSWKIEKYLTSSEEFRIEKEKLNGVFYKITTKFVVGLLLNFLKKKVQETHKLHFSKTILIIPFWITNYHRQQLVEAGIFAGFPETHLIDENVAVAVYAFQTIAVNSKREPVTIKTNHVVDMNPECKCRDNNCSCEKEKSEPVIKETSTEQPEKINKKSNFKNDLSTAFRFLSKPKKTPSTSNQVEKVPNIEHPVKNNTPTAKEEKNSANEGESTKHSCLDYDVFVISENSCHVDATIFRIEKLDKNQRYLKIAGHSKYYDVHDKEDCRQKGVNEACLTAKLECKKQDTFLKRLGKVNTNKYVCISVETECWNVILSVGKIHYSNSAANVKKVNLTDNLAILGANIYINNITGIKINREIIPQNFLPHDNPETAHQPFHDVYKRLERLQLGLKENKKSEKETDSNDATSSQISAEIDICHISSEIKLNQNCCSFEILNNHHGNLLASSPFKLEPELKETQSPDSAPEQISNKSDTKKLKKLIGKFELLQKRIEAGEGNFISSLGKEMVLKQILSSVEDLKSCSSDSVIELQTNIHSAMLSKYFPNVQR